MIFCYNHRFSSPFSAISGAVSESPYESKGTVRLMDIAAERCASVGVHGKPHSKIVMDHDKVDKVDTNMSVYYGYISLMVMDKDYIMDNDDHISYG